MGDLVAFHSREKLLLLAHDRRAYQELGRLVAAAKGRDREQVTALWLAVAERVEGQTGKFWFDRKAVPTHLMRRTREDEQQRRRLWQVCESYSNPPTTPSPSKETTNESPLDERQEPENGS